MRKKKAMYEYSQADTKIRIRAKRWLRKYDIPFSDIVCNEDLISLVKIIRHLLNPKNCNRCGFLDRKVKNL